MQRAAQITIYRRQVEDFAGQVTRLTAASGAQHELSAIHTAWPNNVIYHYTVATE